MARAYRDRERKHLPEYKALYQALGAAPSGLEMGFFVAPCVICGRKKSAIVVREHLDGTVSCACKACGATKETICAAIGIDPVPYRAERIFEEEMKIMAALDVIGANRCTACEHYVSIVLEHGQRLYGCKVRNQYRMDELFDAPDNGACAMYSADRAALRKGIDETQARIEGYRRVVEAYEQRMSEMKALLSET